MTRPIAIRPLTRYTPDGRALDQDLVAVEAPISLHLFPHTGPHRDLGLLMRTPGDDEDLAVGVLAAEGVVKRSGDIVRIETVATGHAYPMLRVTIGPEADAQAISDRAVTATSACGLCGRLSMRQIDHLGAALSLDAPTVTASVVRAIPERLRESQEAFAQTGSLHAAGIFTADGRRLEVREDVGRHNAVDKVIGALLRRDALPATDVILAVSGRIAYEIVQKAAMSGVPILIAVGAPTDLAVDAARACGITLVGFVREGRFNVYTHPGRVVEDGL